MLQDISNERYSNMLQDISSEACKFTLVQDIEVGRLSEIL